MNFVEDIKDFILIVSKFNFDSFLQLKCFGEFDSARF